MSGTSRRREDQALSAPISVTTSGQNRAVPLLRHGTVRRSRPVGTASTPTSIWINPVRWMWAYATGRRRYRQKNRGTSYEKVTLSIALTLCIALTPLLTIAPEARH